MESKLPKTHHNTAVNSPEQPPCTDPACFFCAMNNPNPSLRRAQIAKSLKQLPHTTNQDLVLVLTALRSVAAAHPDDPELPDLGVLESMSKLILRGLSDKRWLQTHQNVYVPYYAADVIGSYVTTSPRFAARALKGGAFAPLMELLRGKLSWVEQRVAVRAMGRLASHEKTFKSIAVHETEIVKLAVKMASTCVFTVYDEFLSVGDGERVRYHSDLLTHGAGGFEAENRRAEQWTAQIQSWSLHLINRFAEKNRSLTLSLICETEFSKSLCKMSSGIGILRTLCFTKTGRKIISETDQVVKFLGNAARSSGDSQVVGIECLVQLLKDPDTRYKVIDVASLFLADLVELDEIENRASISSSITQALLLDYHKIKYGKLRLKSKIAERALGEIWDLKVERKKTETLMTEQELNRRRQSVKFLKKMGNIKFWSGDIKKAVAEYSEALDLCPLGLRKERVVLYSNRAQCHLLLRDSESAISDSTRALCLSSGAGELHGKSLWRRSQAYDMEGLGKESLMDCLMFVNGRAPIPCYAAKMMEKQMDATWIFGEARLRKGRGRR